MNRVLPDIEQGLQLIEQMMRTSQKEGIFENITMVLKGIAPTICGVKAGELLTYPLKLQQQPPNCYEDWQVLKPLLKCCLSIDFVEVKKANGTRQILIYHKRALKDILIKKEILDFLKELGYPQTVECDTHFTDYLETITKRLKGSDFPHEVGVFLGYPLNDVKGFMGFGTRPLAYIQGWQVYDPVEATKVWTKLTLVREAIDKMSVSVSVCQGDGSQCVKGVCQGDGSRDRK